MARGDTVSISPNADGSFMLRGMRVFSTVDAGENGNKTEVTREWLDQAMARAQRRLLSDGYAAPVHLNHSSTGRKIGAGSFVPVAIEEIEYMGVKRPTVLVNARVPAWVADKVRKGEMPFRSVEIPSDGTPDLASLALMDDTVPFFRYGNLTGVVEPELEAAGTMTVTSFAAASRPMIAFSDNGKKRTALYEAKDEQYEDGEAEDEEGDSERDDEQGDDEGEETPVAAMPVADAEGKPKEQAAAEGGAAGANPLAQKIDAMLAWLQRIGEKLLGEKPPANSPQNPVEPNEMAAQPAGGKPVPKNQPAPTPTPAGGTQLALPPEVTEKLSQFDALMTRVGALELGNSSAAAAATSQREAATRLTAAKAKLNGHNLSTQDDADLAEFAALGQVHLDRVVSMIERRPRDMGGDIEEFFSRGSTDGGTGEPADVAKYAADPKKYARAKELARAHVALQKVGIGASLKEYLDVNMDPKLAIVDVGPPR